MRILLEDEYVLALHKPAGIATETSKIGEKDLYSEAMNYISVGNKQPYLAILNRLDQPVEGIVLFAKDEKTAAVLSRFMQEGRFNKYYEAVVFGHVDKKKDTLMDYLIKDGRTNVSRIASKNEKGAKLSQLEYEVMEESEKTTKLKVHLLTGRHHQIRVQCAGMGHPIIGDAKYGTKESIEYSKNAGVRYVSLVANRLEFPHPYIKDKQYCVILEDSNL